MPGAELSSWDPLFKDDVAPAIVQTMQEENLIQAFMEEELPDETWQGRQKIEAIKLGRNWSTGSIGEKGALPVAGRGSYQDYKIPIRDIYTRVGFGRYVIEQSKNKKGALESVIPQEMEGAVEDLIFRRNVMAWGYGSGILALVNGAHTAATTLEVKSPLNVTGTTNANRYLFGDATSGMMIAVLASAAPTTIKGVATITAVNADGTDVTVDTAITAADGDYVVIAQSATQNSYNKEPEGLLAGIDDGTYAGMYHNLSRTTYPQIQSKIFTSVGALSLDAMQQAIDSLSIRVGSGIDLLAGEHSLRRAYLALLEADRRYTGADLKSPDGGTKAGKKPTGRNITYGDIPMLVDRDCPYGMLFGIHKAGWKRYTLKKGEWAQDEGSILKWVNERDEYTAFFVVMENYHNSTPARNFRMEGITVSALVVHAI